MTDTQRRAAGAAEGAPAEWSGRHAGLWLWRGHHHRGKLRGRVDENVSGTDDLNIETDKVKGTKMDFLIIGNGFDLTHRLKTRYVDFLKYCRDYDTNNPVSALPKLNEEFRIFLANNVWLKYLFDLVRVAI